MEERFVSTLPTLFLSRYSDPYRLTFRLRGSRNGYDWKNRLGPVRGGILYVTMSARVHCREVCGTVIPSGGHGSKHRLGGQAKKGVCGDAVSALATWPLYSLFLLSGASCEHL